MRRGFLAASVLAMATMAFGAASAQAVTTTFGNPLTDPGYSSTFFGGPSGMVNTTLVSGAPGTSPTDGTITGWAATDAVGTFYLSVAHPTGGNQYSFTAVGPSVTLNIPGVPSPVQPVSLPIKKGDYPVLSINTGSIYYDPTRGAADYFDPPPTLGGTGALGANANDTENWVFNVNIRHCIVPNLKGKSLGAAKKTLTAADCTFGKKIKPKIKKKKRKKLGVSSRVKSQSVAAGTSISDTAPVDVTFGTKKKKKKK
jgi:PASTA domain-containing protein